MSDSIEKREAWPLVSVVIPTYNRRERLLSCVLSILGQSVMPHEIIVVNDGSTDGTGDAVRSLGHAKVRIIDNVRKKGAQGARNSGVLAATGDWIAFQDSDDTWDRSKLKSQMEVLLSAGASSDVMVHCSGYHVDINGRRTAFDHSRFSGKDGAGILLTPGPMLQGLLVHKSALFDIGLLDENCPAYHEWDTYITLASGRRLLHSDHAKFDWIQHDQETLSKDMRREYVGYRYVSTKHRAKIIKKYGYFGLLAAQQMPLLSRRLRGQASKSSSGEGPKQRKIFPEWLVVQLAYALGRLLGAIGRVLRNILWFIYITDKN